jgi:hypothetical protein
MRGNEMIMAVPRRKKAGYIEMLSDLPLVSPVLLSAQSKFK